MWRLLSGYTNYIKIGLAVLLLCSAFYGGYHIGNSKYLAYKAEVETIARTQEAKVQSIQAQHELVTRGIKDEYEAKLSAVRNYYKSASMWNKSSTSTVPGISATTSVTDVISSYNVLAGQCSQSTLMLVELQKWINEQAGTK
jgi:hypothetical protein